MNQFFQFMRGKQPTLNEFQGSTDSIILKWISIPTDNVLLNVNEAFKPVIV